MRPPDLAREGARAETTRVRPALLTGWPVAVRESVLAALVVAALGQFVAFLVVGGGLVPGASSADAGRLGWLLFYLFHHVGVVAQTPSLRLPSHADVAAGLPAGYSADAIVGFALMGGTALAVWLLHRAGRRTARRTGGAGIVAGLHGAKVAVPYALLSWATAWALEFRVAYPGTSTFLVHPSHSASFFWPLALAAVAGFAGGIRSGEEGLWSSEWWQSERWNRRWRGAFSGAWRMSLLALGASVLAILGLALARPHDAAAYFGAVASAGAGGAAALLLLNLLVLPNMAVWLLVPAMGGCLEVNGSAVYRPFCFLSYGSFAGHQSGATGASGFPGLAAAPPVFYLFLLVPLLPVLLGGWHGADRALARSRAEAAEVGAMAGVVFAAIFSAAVALALLTVRLKGPFYLVSTGYWRYGPSPVIGPQLGLVWGVLGGALGGLLRGPVKARPDVG